MAGLAAVVGADDSFLGFLAPDLPGDLDLPVSTGSAGFVAG